MCYCGNTRVERIPKWESTQKVGPGYRYFCLFVCYRRSCLESNPGHSEHETGVPPLSHPGLPLTGVPSKSYHRRLGSLLLCSSDVCQAWVNSLVCYSWPRNVSSQKLVLEHLVWFVKISVRIILSYSNLHDIASSIIENPKVEVKLLEWRVTLRLSEQQYLQVWGNGCTRKRLTKH